LTIVGIEIPTIACDGVKKQSTHDHFLGVDLKLPSNTVIKRDEKNETIIFLKGKNLSKELERDKEFQNLQSKDLFPEIALAFLSANRSLFKIVEPRDELTVKSTTTDEIGLTHVKFQQIFNGLSVWACEINIHLNQAKHIYLIQGRYIPTPADVDINPVLQEKDVKRIVSENLGVDGSKCSECRSEMIICTALDGEPCLAYRIVATPRVTEGWEFIIDATTGEVLEKLPTVYDAKSR